MCSAGDRLLGGKRGCGVCGAICLAGVDRWRVATQVRHKGYGTKPIRSRPQNMKQHWIAHFNATHTAKYVHFIQLISRSLLGVARPHEQDQRPGKKHRLQIKQSQNDAKHIYYLCSAQLSKYLHAASQLTDILCGQRTARQPLYRLASEASCDILASPILLRQSPDQLPWNRQTRWRGNSCKMHGCSSARSGAWDRS